jgi:CBS domain-containing protein
MKVESFMQKDVITINHNISIIEASMILMDNKITGAPVVDAKNKLVGVISEKDIFKRIYPNYQEYSIFEDKEKDEDIEAQVQEAKNIKVSDIMTKNVITANPSDSAIKIGAMMMVKKINRVIIVDKNELVGIVSRKDIFPQSFKKALENN